MQVLRSCRRGKLSRVNDIMAVSLIFIKAVEFDFLNFYSLLTTTTTTTTHTLSMRSFEIIVSLSLAIGVSALAAPVNPRSYKVRSSFYFPHIVILLSPIGERSRISYNAYDGLRDRKWSPHKAGSRLSCGRPGCI
jgi:hypothetical protein